MDKVTFVARAICWEANGKYNDCATACMKANACKGDLNECFVRDAKAAIAANDAYDSSEVTGVS